MLLFAIAAALGFSPIRTTLEVGLSPDSAASVAAGWVKGGRAAPSEAIELRIALTQNKQGVAALLRVFEQVSDPSSPQYGKHSTNEQVNTLVAPPASAIAAVRAHFKAHTPGAAIEAATPNSDQLVVVTTIGAAEAALGCEYHEYTHPRAGRALRSTSYSLPSELDGLVDFVAPTVRLPSVWGGAAALPKMSSPDGLFNTAKSLRKLYSVDDVVGSAPGNRQAVTGFLGQHFHQSDLSEFNLLFFSQARGYVSAKMATKGDSPTGLLSGTEAMLDAEYMTALGANISSEFWGFSGNAPDNPQKCAGPHARARAHIGPRSCAAAVARTRVDSAALPIVVARSEPFLKWLGVVSSTSDASVPKLFSTSYGEDEASVSTAYADRINIEFQKAGARGISLLFASGDSGANCQSNKFEPNWPAASPYVTAVGGTAGSAPEQAVGLSSGGFSNRYGTPSWQKEAVATYLASPKVPTRSLFNASGRGFPDIAAQAVNFVVVTNLIPEPGVAGTSCASPTAAGVIGLLNDLRLAKGKSSLGFLNPLLCECNPLGLPLAAHPMAPAAWGTA